MLYDLLRVNADFRLELAPHLYATTVVRLLHPHQLLRWIDLVGGYNSSFLRGLTIKFSSLGPALGTLEQDLHQEVWSDVISKLDYLVYHYEPSQHYNQQRVGLDEDHPCQVTTFGRAMQRIEVPGLYRVRPRESCDCDVLENLPASHARPITHAVLAIDEPMPEINMMSFMKLLSLDIKTSLPQSLTGLPPEFFADHGLELVRTYTMIEDPQKQSVAMTYRRVSAINHVELPNLRLILCNLPRLLYLRLGCPNVDSAFLTFLPPRLQTVDVSFRDPNPERVSQNLRRMRQQCKQLFTFAIAISPLHDVIEMPDGGRQIDANSNDDHGVSQWEPFRDALRFIQSTGVKVWEGEGPRFKRVG